ncbi:MAG: hypothetical protein EPN17_12310 [Methylobacter sp.]|nr:MAG: hypothetical protein EPN17_12310 [Methylobacter sp.]
MPHIHETKAVVGAEMATMMDASMRNMSLSSMMSESMGSIMKNPSVASGAVVSAGSGSGKSLIREIVSHPLALFGLGVVAGCYVYKYRKSIISTSNEAQQ